MFANKTLLVLFLTKKKNITRRREVYQEEHFKVFGLSPLPAMRWSCFKPWRRSPSPSIKSTVIDENGKLSSFFSPLYEEDHDQELGKEVVFSLQIIIIIIKKTAREALVRDSGNSLLKS